MGLCLIRFFLVAMNFKSWINAMNGRALAKKSWAKAHFTYLTFFIPDLKVGAIKVGASRVGTIKVMVFNSTIFNSC